MLLMSRHNKATKSKTTGSGSCKNQHMIMHRICWMIFQLKFCENNHWLGIKYRGNYVFFPQDRTSLCIVGGWVITHKVKALRERLDDINGDSEQFHLEVRDEEKVSLNMAREQISSEPGFMVEREGDQKAVRSFVEFQLQR